MLSVRRMNRGGVLHGAGVWQPLRGVSTAAAVGACACGLAMNFFDGCFVRFGADDFFLGDCFFFCCDVRVRVRFGVGMSRGVVLSNPVGVIISNSLDTSLLS